MCGCLIAEEQAVWVPFARAVFEACWSDLEDISQPEVLARVAARTGLVAKAPRCRATASATTTVGTYLASGRRDRSCSAGRARVELTRAQCGP
jgi:2-hydroxychromene-2-carboxylate isomerase